jgi:hypothetical protein
MINSAEELVRLRSSTDPALYERAAREEAPLHVWREVVQRFPDFRKWVAHNKTVLIEILEALADDPDDRARYMVAMKSKLTPEILAKLALDPHDSVRMQVARHKRAPRELLEQLLPQPGAPSLLARLAVAVEHHVQCYKVEQARKAHLLGRRHDGVADVHADVEVEPSSRQPGSYRDAHAVVDVLVADHRSRGALLEHDAVVERSRRGLACRASHVRSTWLSSA